MSELSPDESCGVGAGTRVSYIKRVAWYAQGLDESALVR
jgi:hypothetical protein